MHQKYRLVQAGTALCKHLNRAWRLQKVQSVSVICYVFKATETSLIPLECKLPYANPPSFLT